MTMLLIFYKSPTKKANSINLPSLFNRSTTRGNKGKSDWDLRQSRGLFLGRSLQHSVGTGVLTGKAHVFTISAWCLLLSIRHGVQTVDMTRRNDTAHDFRFTVLVTLSCSSVCSTVCLHIMFPFIFGCVSFQYDGFSPNQLQRTKEKQSNTNRQANKQRNRN